MNGERLNIGIIGLGGISSAHLEGYLSEPSSVSIAAVCDTRTEVLNTAAKTLGARSYGGYEDLIADPGVDAVDITLPHNLHYEVALKALTAGKHVLVEKPMSPSTEECSELIRIATEKRVVFTAAENTPFVTSYLRIRELLEAEAVGKIRTVKTFIYGSEVSRLTNPSLWKGRMAGAKGGAIMDAGPHSFYLLKWLFGKVSQLQASSWKLVEESEVEDNAVVSGRFNDGPVFVAEFSFTAEIPWGERLEIYGDKGSIITDQLQDPVVRIFRGKDDFAGESISSVPFEPKNWKVNSIASGVRDFVAAVREHRDPQVSPQDALYSVYVAERAYESVASGGRIVEV